MPTTKSADQKVQTRGAKRMRERGHKAVVVWLDSRELALAQAAADGERLKLATWIRKLAFHAAMEADRKRQREEV